MRFSLLILPILLATEPALAAPAPAPVQMPSRALNAQVADRITGIMHAMSNAFLDVPVGEIKAASEGRQPTEADRHRTLRTETGLDQQQVDRQIEDSRVVMERSAEAMATALPKIAEAVHSASREIEKAAANMPSPIYPRR